MTAAKQLVRNLIRKLGYEVTRRDPAQMGVNPFRDMRVLLAAEDRPVILDVGANVGQSVHNFLSFFPSASIHSFEPSPTTFKKLTQEVSKYPGVKPWNAGIGSAEGMLPFIENSSSAMSSFLHPDEFAWGTIERSVNVEVRTIDSFVTAQGIDFVHILKSDTQGFEFEVFKGADGLMQSEKIGMVYFEFIFSKMYENLPPFHEVFRYLTDRNFALVAAYDQHFQNDLLSWMDVLFINRSFDSHRSSGATAAK